MDTKTTQHVPKTTSAKRGAAAPQNQILVSRTTASAAMESADSSVTNVGILISSIEYGKIDLPYAWKGRPTYKPVANIHSKISPPPTTTDHNSSLSQMKCEYYNFFAAHVCKPKNPCDGDPHGNRCLPISSGPGYMCFGAKRFLTVLRVLRE